MTERMTVSFGAPVAERVRRCGAHTRGGASGYLERLVREDELREAARSAARWFSEHPGYDDDARAESDATSNE